MAIRVVAIVMLVLSFAPMPIGYYTLLRIVVCGAAAYLAYESGNGPWRWIWGAIAIVFNPIFPLYLGRDIWRVVDALVIIVLSVSLLREGRRN